MQTVFITGGTGYMGTRLITALQKNGKYNIQALVRKGSEHKLPGGCEVIIGNALDAETYKDKIAIPAIFVHLVGVAHPSPAKKEAFQKIDLVSIQQAVKAAVFANVEHFIYLSVALYPTKIMKDFQNVRAEGERLLSSSKLRTSFIRPWYVLGPGHYWPILLKPIFWLLKFIPSKKETAIKLDTVTIQQMINVLIHAVKTTITANTVYDVVDIKKY